MHTRVLRSLPFLVLLASGCSMKALGIRQRDGLVEVDQLLSHVERVQVESAVARERTHAAVESLRKMVAPEFKGDPIVAHQEFEAAVEEVEDQARALLGSVRPLKSTGERVFASWAENLESFGNVSMRQRSQERLEETRRRYDAILAAAGMAQLALDAFHRDLADQALFLEHDFNASSVALVAQELEGLKSRGRELAKRLDATIAACRAYVEFTAPGAQLEPPSEPAASSTEPPAAPTAEGAPRKPAPKKKPAATSTASPAPAKGG